MKGHSIDQETYLIRSSVPLVPNNERGDFPVLAADKHPGKQRKSRADWRAVAVEQLKIMCYDMAF